MFTSLAPNTKTLQFLFNYDQLCKWFNEKMLIVVKMEKGDLSLKTLRGTIIIGLGFLLDDSFELTKNMKDLCDSIQILTLDFIPSRIFAMFILKFEKSYRKNLEKIFTKEKFDELVEQIKQFIGMWKFYGFEFSGRSLLATFVKISDGVSDVDEDPKTLFEYQQGKPNMGKLMQIVEEYRPKYSKNFENFNIELGIFESHNSKDIFFQNEKIFNSTMKNKTFCLDKIEAICENDGKYSLIAKSFV